MQRPLGRCRRHAEASASVCNPMTQVCAPVGRQPRLRRAHLPAATQLDAGTGAGAWRLASVCSLPASAGVNQSVQPLSKAWGFAAIHCATADIMLIPVVNRLSGGCDHQLDRATPCVTEKLLTSGHCIHTVGDSHCQHDLQMQRGIAVAGLNAYEDSDQYIAPPEPPAHLAEPGAAEDQAASSANRTAAAGQGGGASDGSGDGSVNGSGGSGSDKGNGSGDSAGSGKGVGGRRLLLAGDADADGRSAMPSGSLSVLGGALDTVRSWTPEARRQAAAAQERVITWSCFALTA